MAVFLLSEDESQKERELAAAWSSFFELMLKSAEADMPQLLEETKKLNEKDNA